MDKQLICNVIQDRIVDPKVNCRNCCHQRPHSQEDECEQSNCDRINIVCGCVQIKEDWDT
jgi:hypothetical protein